jgi:hypothetical protein
VALSEQTVAALAEQVADLIRSWLLGHTVGVRVAPSLAWGTDIEPAWWVYFDVGPDRTDSVAVYLRRLQSDEVARDWMIETVSGELSETSVGWGKRFPP